MAHDLDLRGRIETLDRETGEALLVFGPTVVGSESWPPPARVSLIPQEIIPTEPLQAAVETLAGDWLNEGRLPNAPASTATTAARSWRPENPRATPASAWCLRNATVLQDPICVDFQFRPDVVTAERIQIDP